MTSTSVPGSPRLAGALLRQVLRVVMLVLGAVLTLVLFALGLLLALGLVVWALLRGRRPVVAQAFTWHRARAASRPASADVVDIDAREVHEPRDPRPPASITER